MKKFKIVEIGPYPPPNSGWSVRIKHLRDSFLEQGVDCRVLNLGKQRKEKSAEYIDVQNGIDYVKKLFLLRMRGYHFHVHMNAQAVKGPILILLALLISLLFLERAALTFHGGVTQLYFPKENGGKMYWVIYLNLLLSKVVICNDETIRQEIGQYGPFIHRNKIHPIPAFCREYLKFNITSLPEPLERFIQKQKRIIVSYLALREGFYIETLLDYLERFSHGNNTGIVLAGFGDIEDPEIVPLYHRLQQLERKGHVLLLVQWLNHDQFMTLLKRSDLYLRTCISDGVASSVLESLSVGTPVVAGENNRRPVGVITYQADQAFDLREKVAYALSNLEQIKKELPVPEVQDTLRTERRLLQKTLGE